MNLRVQHTYGDIGKIYGHENVLDWIEEITDCLKKNKETKSGFIPQEVCVHNIERIFGANHRIFICGNKTNEYDTVVNWIKSLDKEEQSIFNLYAIDIDEEKSELHFFFKVY